MSDHDHTSLWGRINTAEGSIIRLQERSDARTKEYERLERRIARIEMAVIAVLTGGGFIVAKQIVESAGLSI